MKVSLWAEIRRLREIEQLSQRAIAERLQCSRGTVKRALLMKHAPTRSPSEGSSILDPYKAEIDKIIEQYPSLSAVRVLEKISTPKNGAPGYTGRITLVRDYLRRIRPTRGRVYQDISHEAGDAMQVDWGHCGSLPVANTIRKLSVFVAVLCHSRMCYIEFTLSQRKAEFYRSLAHALEFFGGSPKRIVFDNLKAAVVNGSGRHACLHPEFQALCGHFCMEPVACAARDPESKGMVEAHVGYVKRNALQGRDEELTCLDDYRHLARQWRDEVANVRIHQTLKQRPIDRFEQERALLRPLPSWSFDTDEVALTEVRSTAQVPYDGNRYTVPPRYTRKPVTVRADENRVRILFQGEQIASHPRCYGRGQLVADSQHQLEALQMRRRQRRSEVEANFAALGEEARQFELKLRTLPVKSVVHLRKLLELARLYGREEVVEALQVALEYETYDAAYVEAILQQNRRRKSLPSPTTVRPQRADLTKIDIEEPDPARYDRLGQEPTEEPE
ncbi:MAG: IS21 family transposase [Planctomycetales bacterium]|nr:IS21 family transposase [Planctomycetales bacterium]